MADLKDVRAIAAELPGVTEAIDGHRGGAVWRTTGGGFAWERGPSKTDLAKLAALSREWPDGVVVGIRTDSLETKDALLAELPDVLFTIPHFDGYPAVLCRLDDVDPDDLRELVIEAWLTRAPKTIAKQWLADNAPARGPSSRR